MGAEITNERSLATSPRPQGQAFDSAILPLVNGAYLMPTILNDRRITAVASGTFSNPTTAKYVRP